MLLGPGGKGGGVLRGAETEASGLGLFSLLMAHLQP